MRTFNTSEEFTRYTVSTHLSEKGKTDKTFE